MTFLLKEKSLLLHAIHRILIRRAPVLEGNGQEGDEEDDAESQGEHPPVDRRTIGEIFEPAGGREVSGRCSKEEADHDDHKNAVKATDRPTTFSPAAILKRLRTLKKLRKSVFITDCICSIPPNKIQKLYHNT